jgi:hypothetical protein
MTDILHWLLVHHVYIGPLFVQAHQTFLPRADGAPINYAPVIGSRTGGMNVGGVILYGRFYF